MHAHDDHPGTGPQGEHLQQQQQQQFMANNNCRLYRQTGEDVNMQWQQTGVLQKEWDRHWATPAADQ